MRKQVFSLLFLLGPQTVLSDSVASSDDAPQPTNSDDETLSFRKASEHSGQILGSVQSSGLFQTIGQLIPHNLRQFIFEANQKHDAEGNLEERQAVAPGGGVAPGEVSSPTQMPTVTAFQLSGKVEQYTQTFPPTPGQWPGPTNGAIGLGTIQGQVGTVKNSGS